MPVFFRHAAAFQMLKGVAVANLEPLATSHETLQWKTLCMNTGPCASFLKTIYVETHEKHHWLRQRRRGEVATTATTMANRQEQINTFMKKNMRIRNVLIPTFSQKLCQTPTLRAILCTILHQLRPRARSATLSRPGHPSGKGRRPQCLTVRSLPPSKDSFCFERALFVPKAILGSSTYII
jgi:hypothetical protein